MVRGDHQATAWVVPNKEIRANGLVLFIALICNHKSQMMKFRIVQHITPNIDVYAKYSIASVYQYALRHNYEYWLLRDNNTRGLFTHYTKIDALKTLLDLDEPDAQDEYVVFIDADMVLIEPERELRWFVDTYGTDKTVIYMPQDVGKESHRKKRPFTCVIIIKRNDAGREIINNWIDVSLNEGKHHNEAHPYEQGVYWDYVMPQLGEKQVILPLKYFEFSPIQRLGLFRHKKPFLDHLLRRSTEKRVKMMGALYDKYIKDDLLLESVESQINNHPKGMLKFSGDHSDLKLTPLP